MQNALFVLQMWVQDGGNKQIIHWLGVRTSSSSSMTERKKRDYSRACLPVGVARLVGDAEGDVVSNQRATGTVVRPGQGEPSPDGGGDDGIVGRAVDNLGGSDVNPLPSVTGGPDATGEDAVWGVGAVSGSRRVRRGHTAGGARSYLDKAMVGGLEVPGRAAAGVDETKSDRAFPGGSATKVGVVGLEADGSNVAAWAVGRGPGARGAPSARSADLVKLDLGDGAGLDVTVLDDGVSNLNRSDLPGLGRQDRGGGSSEAGKEQGEERLHIHHCDGV
jgi:hypothetical protein